MEYREIPQVGKRASRIVFGTAGPSFWRGQDCSELLDGVFDLGINMFDTARVYGKSERVVGRWLEKSQRREKIVLLSKCGHPNLILGTKRVNAKEMFKDLEKSLSELGTDYIDIYLLHRDDAAKDVGELVEAFNEMAEKGKIRAFGGSNWTHQRIEEANEYAYKHSLKPFSVSSPNMSLAEQVNDAMGGCISISGPGQEEARDWYRKNQMPLVAYASLAQGLMSGKIKSSQAQDAKKILGAIAAKGFASPDNFERLRRCEVLAEQKGCTVSQVALSWVLSQDLNTFAVVSSSSLARMEQNIGALDVPLSPGELEYLDLKAEL